MFDTTAERRGYPWLNPGFRPPYCPACGAVAPSSRRRPARVRPLGHVLRMTRKPPIPTNKAISPRIISNNPHLKWYSMPAPPSPRGRLEPLGKRFKEFASGKGRQRQPGGRERVNVRMRAGVNGAPADWRLAALVPPKVYFTSVRQNFSIRSRPFSRFAMLVA